MQGMLRWVPLRQNWLVVKDAVLYRVLSPFPQYETRATRLLVFTGHKWHKCPPIRISEE